MSEKEREPLDLLRDVDQLLAADAASHDDARARADAVAAFRNAHEHPGWARSLRVVSVALPYAALGAAGLYLSWALEAASALFGH